jgi:hypothetical protein
VQLAHPSITRLRTRPPSPGTRVCNLHTLSRTFHCACRAGPART